MVLGLDDHYALAGDALVAAVQQSRFDRVGQRRGGNVEAQVDGRGDLVHILAAGPLGPHSADLDFAERDRNAVADLEHA